MKERLFRFKQFSVAHSKSAMKVGVDGVLIGAWAGPSKGLILDVGCGCGLIALMMAQRNNNASIIGIDIHSDSIEEAHANIESSPWSDQIELFCIGFNEFIDECNCIINKDLRNDFDKSNAPSMIFSKMQRYNYNIIKPFDLIISNPPFFNAGVTTPITPREQARHQGTLTPSSILTLGQTVLSSKGKIAMIVPASEEKRLKDVGSAQGLVARRECFVRDHPGAPVKRVMIEFEKIENLENSIVTSCDTEELVLFDENRIATKSYQELCKDFYLKF